MNATRRSTPGEMAGGIRDTVLRRMKSEHEQRIERVSGIAPNWKSHILLYGANVGDHSSPLNYVEAAQAQFPSRYPATDTPIELTTVSSSFSDRDADFWAVEAESLRRKFSQRVGERLAIGDIQHMSVFALAPQPLLILLGSLLGDIVPANVYQRHREPPTWEWPATASAPVFEVREPTASSGSPVVVLALSATVTLDRITVRSRARREYLDRDGADSAQRCHEVARATLSTSVSAPTAARPRSRLHTDRPRLYMCFRSRRWPQPLSSAVSACLRRTCRGGSTTK